MMAIRTSVKSRLSKALVKTPVQCACGPAPSASRAPMELSLRANTRRMGYAREYHVERYLREAWIPRLAPVSPQLILCFIAEKVLGLPKSY